MSPSTRTLTLLTRNLVARPLTTSRPAMRPTPTTRTIARASSTFNPGPSPPRLPAEQQAEFERLQREASVADFSSTTPAVSEAPRPVQVEDAATNNGAAAATSGGIRKGAPPEFEGEVNPKTGEVGGPKNEPLRWGAAGDYSFNGRVTDF
ncbi:hypothetical protein MCOR25_009404 [Pyricularia grisea]|uniref:Succinate dehydrogenase assembly factor 4, mitochondrial n=1 Tax=Pyricularia grisea TaxID=148305 RepID=A0A6P8B4D8_PYRGI|nr:hypothetical protein PgNI_05453 [Pyricularia grisea]KAI6352491.1 hypothetical protein MCOR25_009404 [Pyricularia grisea]TLD09994.1 hypothetical protein PgNI_05453 [Pyricularia grisea]